MQMVKNYIKIGIYFDGDIVTSALWTITIA